MSKRMVLHGVVLMLAMVVISGGKSAQKGFSELASESDNGARPSNGPVLLGTLKVI